MTVLKHEFVEFIPDEFADNTIYISVKFATVAHCCCCGCGKEVVTPLSPSDWQLTFDGETVSLVPSVGNWSFPCQSHYWIVRNGVRWAEQWSADEIAAGRVKDTLVKERYYNSVSRYPSKQVTTPPAHEESNAAMSKSGIFQRLKKRFFG